MLAPGPTLVSGIPRLAGVAIGLGGLGVTVRAGRQFEEAETNIVSFDDPDRLVADGLFAWSRNPMYLGFGVALAGVAVALGTASPWLGVVAFVAVMDRVYVRYEEARMAAVFGREFDRYCAGVRRWFGRRAGAVPIEEAGRAA